MVQHPHDFRISLTEEELRLFKEFNVKNILEVFCGDGRNLIALAKLGYNLTGIEENKKLLGQAKENIERVGESIELIEHPIFEKPLPLENESFGAVYSWQYINHNFQDKIEKVF